MGFEHGDRRYLNERLSGFERPAVDEGRLRTESLPGRDDDTQYAQCQQAYGAAVFIGLFYRRAKRSCKYADCVFVNRRSLVIVADSRCGRADVFLSFPVTSHLWLTCVTISLFRFPVILGKVTVCFLSY